MPASKTQLAAVDSARGARGYSAGRAPAVIWVLTLAFSLLCATWSVLTPPLLAPDETAHVSATIRLTDSLEWPSPADVTLPNYLTQVGAQRGLPPSARQSLPELAETYPGDSERVDQMTQHPPLYYLLGSALLESTGATEWRWDQATLLLRLLGALLAAPLVWLAWSSVATLTRSRRAGIVAAGVVFLVPGLAQMLGVTNNDTLAILLGSVVAWLCVRVMTGDRRARMLVGLGVAFGLAGLAKGTLITFGVLVVLALWTGPNHPASWPRRLWQILWPLLIAFVCGQWWWLRNLAVYGTLQPYGFLTSETPWPPGTAPNPGTFIDEMWRVTPATFWGWFGRVNAPLPQILVDVLTVTCLVIVCVGMFRFRRTVGTALILASPVALSLILMVRVSWGAYIESTGFRGMHGRYFYPVLIPLIALAAIAALNLIRERRTRVVFGMGAIAVSSVMPFVGLWTLFVYFYAGEDIFAIREGILAWVYGMSPLPVAATLGISLAFSACLAAGAVLGIRELLRERESHGKLEPRNHQRADA